MEEMGQKIANLQQSKSQESKEHTNRGRPPLIMSEEEKLARKNDKELKIAIGKSNEIVGKWSKFINEHVHDNAFRDEKLSSLYAVLKKNEQAKTKAEVLTPSKMLKYVSAILLK